MAIENLIGTWKLVSHRFVATESGEFKEMFGPAPTGSLIISADNHMIALITADGRTPATDAASEATLFKTMLSYAGSLRIEGDQFITTVDVSWHPAWVGTEQARAFSVQNGTLLLMTPELPSPAFDGQLARGILTWEKAQS